MGEKDFGCVPDEYFVFDPNFEMSDAQWRAEYARIDAELEGMGFSEHERSEIDSYIKAQERAASQEVRHAMRRKLKDALGHMPARFTSRDRDVVLIPRLDGGRNSRNSTHVSVRADEPESEHHFQQAAHYVFQELPVEDRVGAFLECLSQL